MLTGMTKKQEEVGFTLYFNPILSEVLFYRVGNYFYKNCDAYDRPIRISKSVFVWARKKYLSEVEE